MTDIKTIEGTYTGGKGNYVILSGEAGHSVAAEITRGYKDTLRKHMDRGDVKVIAEQSHSAWSPGQALRTVEDVLSRAGGKIDAILANPFFEAHPEALEKINGAFEKRSRDLDDTRSRLRIEKAFHGMAREELGRTNDELGKARDELSDIKYRRGFRHFLRLSDLIEDNLTAPRPERRATEACADEAKSADAKPVAAATGGCC